MKVVVFHGDSHVKEGYGGIQRLEFPVKFSISEGGSEGIPRLV